MKSVLISIKPQWCEKIASGRKTIEVRKSAPKEVPFKVYIYCCKDNAQEIVLLKDYKNRFSFGDYRNADGHFYDVANRTVIGEFICNEVMSLMPLGLRGFKMREEILKSICLTNDDLNTYGGLKTLYGWHISDLKIYDKPKELREFRKPLDRVWCSYCNDYCDRGCISFGNTDYSCNDYWNWEKGLTRPPQSYVFVEEI